MDNKRIDMSLKIVEKEGFFHSLNKLYSAVPSGSCDGCGKCCGESVRTHFVEFLNIYNYLMNEGLMTQELKARILTFYFTELTEVKSCPFRLEGKCLIYPVRPLVCRIFGHLTRVEHEEGIGLIHELNQEAADYMEDEYGLKVPDEVIFKTIPYCESFVPEEPVGQEKRVELSTSILMMDSTFFKEGILDEYHMDYGLVQWFVDLWLNEDEVDDLRMKIAKELFENGWSSNLKEVLNKNK